MKVNRFIALAVIALLVVAAMGVITVRGLAQISASRAQQVQVTEAPDTDNVEEETGNQNETETGPEVEDGEEGIQGQDQENEDGDADQAALQSLAKITPAQAQQAALAANPGAKVLKTELDNETGSLFYSVELSNGLSVEVDAATGQILLTEPSD